MRNPASKSGVSFLQSIPANHKHNFHTIVMITYLLLLNLISFSVFFLAVNPLFKSIVYKKREVPNYEE